MPAERTPNNPPDDGAHGRPRPTRFPVGNTWRRPAEPGLVSDRLNILVHELAGLIDGSMRHIGLALRSVDGGAEQDDDLSQRLKTIQHALERMADALRTASGGPPMPWVQAAYRVSLADAANYAVGIMEPVAAAHAIAVTLAIDDRFAALPPGHLYTVLVNGIRNSIEAIVQHRPRGEEAGVGAVRVEGRVEPRAGGEWVVVHITDTGVGPPPLPPSRREAVFHPAFSTKPGGLGIGLSISRRILDELGGTLDLRKGPRGVGATLAIEYPLPQDHSQVA